MITNIFDKDKIDYDNVKDLWYSWLYSRLHYFIIKNIIVRYNPETVLDLGCGTGFQSFLHTSTGSSVVGVDISKHMLDNAKKKSALKESKNYIQVFPETFDFVRKYNEKINCLLVDKTTFKKYHYPTFLIADMCNLPFANEIFSHINCCGSVLSLIEDSHSAISEMSRVLRKGGTLFIEVESKWNLDRLWTLMDVFLKNRLGYYSSFKEALVSITSLFNDISINYPYGESGDPVFIKIKLFNVKTLKNEFFSFQLRIVKRWTIHSITNFIPSIFLDTDFPSRTLKRLFGILSYIEEKVPFCLPGCSMVYLLQKV